MFGLELQYSEPKSWCKRKNNWITVMIDPVPKPTMTKRDVWLNPPRPCVARYRNFVNELREKLTQDVGNSFDVLFVLEIKKSWSKKKKAEKLGQPHDQKPDRDNLLKALQDALTVEDKEIYLGEVGKFWGERSCIVLRPRPDEDLASVLARWQEEEVLTNLKSV